jgi:MFS family permease
VHAPLVVIVTSAVLMAMALGMLATLWDTTVQLQIPSEALSRVAAYDGVTSLTLNPIGMALAGPIAAAIGSEATLAWAGLMMAGPCLAILLLPDVRVLRSLPARA